MKKRLLLLTLSLCLIFGCFSACGTSDIEDEVPETFSFSFTETAKVEMTFKGDEAEKAGFAQSKITVTPNEGHGEEGYYLVYYTDGEKVLSDYDELASIKCNKGKAVSFEVGDGIMLPAEAKGIVVFESDTYFVDEAPAAESAVAAVMIPKSKRLPDLGEAEMSFGAISDTHMNYETYGYGAHNKLDATLKFMSKENMEFVIITGDATGDRSDSPSIKIQYEDHLDIIKNSGFPEDKVYEAIGNHGNTIPDRPLLNQYCGGDDEIHPYEDSPYYHVLFQGGEGERDNLFIFMAQELKAAGDSAAYDNFSKEQIDWVEGLLKQYGETETNIFIIEHSPFLNYGAGDRKNGAYTTCVTFKEEYTQTMRFKALLEQYKDAVVMSGHTHVSFYEGVNYSDEYNEFARTVHIGSNAQPCAYNQEAVYTRAYDGRYEATEEYGSEGYTVDVYSDYIVYTGYNFSTGKKIPAACLLIPVKAYGGAARPVETVLSPEEAFKGSGTVEDPYLISTAEDFYQLTKGFNASVVATEEKMYGYGLYFLQTADIDMTDFEGYSGTIANGSGKCFFAGIYNGGGHTVSVDIDDEVQRSVFPYVYGTVCNLKIEGSITSQVTAQPVRTLYGSVVNCIFEVDLEATECNGILYSNYNLVYNVYTVGTLTGDKPHAVISNDTSTNAKNIFHYRTANGNEISDDVGKRTNDANEIAEAFNNRSSADYNAALEELGGFEMVKVKATDGKLEFDIVKSAPAESAESSAQTDNADGQSGNGIWIWIVIAVVAVVIISACAVIIIKKKKK